MPRQDLVSALLSLDLVSEPVKIVLRDGTTLDTERHGFDDTELLGSSKASSIWQA